MNELAGNHSKKKMKAVILFWKLKSQFLKERKQNHWMGQTRYSRLYLKESINMKINRNYPIYKKKNKK